MKPPTKPPSNVAARPTPLDDHRIFSEREAEIENEGFRHDAGESVGELEQNDEAQDHDGHVAGEKIAEGADGGRHHALERIFSRMRLMFGLRRCRFFRLRCKKSGGNADHRHRGHGEIAERPGGTELELQFTKSAHDEQRARGRDQDANAVGRDIGRHAGGLLALGQAFDAEGVDDDILGRGSGRHQQCRPEDRVPGHFGWIAKGEQHDGRHHRDLRHHEPAAAATEQTRKHRRVERVHHRRPEEFDGVGRAHQREQADSLEIDPGLPHPEPQRRARQRQRQPSREAEKQHDQHARLEIDRQRFAE